MFLGLTLLFDDGKREGDEKTLGGFQKCHGEPPKKKAAPKGKAAAMPAYLTDEEHCAPFGLFANDIVTTPLGIRTVLGVKYAGSVEDRENARVWVRYPNGREAPIENPGNTSLVTDTTGGRNEMLRREAARWAEERRVLAAKIKADRKPRQRGGDKGGGGGEGGRRRQRRRPSG